MGGTVLAVHQGESVSPRAGRRRGGMGAGRRGGWE